MRLHHILLLCVSFAIPLKSFAASDRLEALSQELKKKESQVEKLKNENLLLKKRIGHKDESSLFGQELSAAAEIKLSTINSERDLYVFILKAYREKNLPALQAAVEQFLKRYPVSVYADNALYWLGLMRVQQRQLGEAAQVFNHILRSYPQGNKAVSALFAKGVVYKKLNLKEQAYDSFKELSEKYPGSPESFRAAIELRLLKPSGKNL